MLRAVKQGQGNERNDTTIAKKNLHNQCQREKTNKQLQEKHPTGPSPWHRPIS